MTVRLEPWGLSGGAPINQNVSHRVGGVSPDRGKERRDGGVTYRPSYTGGTSGISRQ